VAYKYSRRATPTLFFWALVLFGLRTWNESYHLLFDDQNYTSEVGGTNILALASWILALMGGLNWAYWYMKKMRGDPLFKMRIEEYQAFIYIAVFIVFIVAAILSNIICGATSWRAVKESSLVSYTYIQLALAVLLTGKKSVSALLSPSLPLASPVDPNHAFHGVASDSRAHSSTGCGDEHGPAHSEEALRAIRLPRDQVQCSRGLFSCAVKT
jgi:hypothetical protein